MLVSTKHPHGAAIGFLSCPLPLEPPSRLPPRPTPLGCYRDPGWVPWVVQQIPVGCLFHTWLRMFPRYSLHTCFKRQDVPGAAPSVSHASSHLVLGHLSKTRAVIPTFVRMKPLRSREVSTCRATLRLVRQRQHRMQALGLCSTCLNCCESVAGLLVGLLLAAGF